MDNIKYSIILFLFSVYILYNHKPELFDNTFHNYIPPITIFFLALFSYYVILLLKKKNI